MSIGEWHIDVKRLIFFMICCFFFFKLIKAQIKTIHIKRRHK